jgi:peptidoglycan hydrolase CwlO-like protein
MQLSSKKNIARESAFGAIKTVAKKNHSLRLAALAATVRTGGHFDQVIAEVDKMITILREEEQEDISVRDACQKKMNELDATKANLETKKDRLEGEKSRVEAKNEQMKKELDDTKKAITDQEKTMEDALNQRNQEHDTYIQALKDDEAAVKLIGQAVAAMSAFYGNNQLTMGLIQSKADPKPETWSKPYGGRSSESKGLVAIMEMLKEDIVKEIGESKTAEKEASAEFVKLRNAGDKMLKGLNQAKVTIEKGIADNESTIADLDKELGNTSAAHADTDAMDKTLSDQTCAWIETSFEARRSARKSEVEGLQQAKAMLAGANDEDTDRMDAQLE